MSEQEASPMAPSAPLHWRVRVCRWLWRILGFVWGTLIVGIVIGTITNLNTTTTGTPLSTLFIIHLVLTYPLPVWSSLGFLAVLTLLSWLGSRDKQATPARPLSEQDRVHLLGRLRLRYEQLLTQSLAGAVQQLELGLAERPAAVQNPVSLMMRLPDQPEQLLPPHTSIVDVYRQAHKELLILGEPGAGKSTLLVELARSLVEQAEQDTTQPLPILLPLSSWAEHKHPLHEWLGEEIARLYDVPRRLSQQWIQAEQLLPLLDGLDEMEENARGACIAAINTYHREHLRPLVVCSRSNEYAAAARHERLALHTALVVQPLEPRQVDAYLVELGKPLSGLRAALKTNALLQTVATTPLLLQVLMLTYHGISVRELPHKEAQLLQQIWTDYVQRMVERKGDIKYYPLNQTITWLSWLARGMREHNQTIFSLEQLKPDWLPKRRRTFYQWSVIPVVVPVVGLLYGLIGGLLFGLGIIPVVGLLFGLLYGLGGGLVFGLPFGLIGGLLGFEFSGTRDSAAEGLGEGLRIALRIALVGGLPIGLLIGLLYGLLHGLLIGLLYGLFGGLLYGLLFWLLYGLLFWLEGGPLIGFSGEFEEEGLVGGLFIGLFIGLVYGLLYGSGGGLGGGLLLLFGLLIGLVSGLGGGLVGGLGIGLVAVVQHYTLRFWLWRTSLFPWKAVSFLDDATARILLRRVGGGYSFAHRLLLDFFADAYAGASSASPAARSILPSPP